MAYRHAVASAAASISKLEVSSSLSRSEVCPAIDMHAATGMYV